MNLRNSSRGLRNFLSDHCFDFSHRFWGIAWHWSVSLLPKSFHQQSDRCWWIVRKRIRISCQSKQPPKALLLLLLERKLGKYWSSSINLSRWRTLNNHQYRSALAHLMHLAAPMSRLIVSDSRRIFFIWRGNVLMIFTSESATHFGQCTRVGVPVNAHLDFRWIVCSDKHKFSWDFFGSKCSNSTSY